MKPIWRFPELPELLTTDISAHGDGSTWRRELAPQLAYGRHEGPARDDARDAAVAILLTWNGAEWSLPLTARAAALHRHGGQVSLPGGLVDEEESNAEAALREVEEELGLRPAVEWIGELAPLFVFASNSVVAPCVGAVREAPTWRPSTAEVEVVIRLDLELLAGDNVLSHRTIRRGPMTFDAPEFVVDGRSVWGATAVILGELRGRLRRIATRLI